MTEDEIIRMFLRDRPEFIPEVWQEPDPDTGAVEWVYTAAGWAGFKAWVAHVRATWPLSKLRACRDYIRTSREDAA